MEAPMHLTDADLDVIDRAGNHWPRAIEAATRAVLEVNQAVGIRSEIRESIAYIEALRAFGSRRKPIYRRKAIIKKDQGDGVIRERRGLSVLRLCAMKAARAARTARSAAQ